MTIDPNILSALAPRPYAEVRETVRDGDLLLCSATDGFSRLIRWATKSPWSHVAIAYRLEEIDRVIVLESVEKIGVRAVPLSSFISRTSSGVSPYPGQILLARHKGMSAKSRRQPMKKMAKFAFGRLGDKFSTRDMARIALRIAFGRFERRMPRSLGARNAFICSEYVARCFKELDLEIPWDGLGFIAPCDFALDPRVEAVAQIKT
ncbi:YiiX/YebB-like N1pC/P60 family cysteine hydrolase [Phenylobacterium sp.]|uniref:YiiX/YebB-like N1pC/P60 family cysteine hydrolase n=1 Tax=Phenylobacterium sp. TaxID=1871053 RepID=UPI002C40403D|nr:YiiX/YebB-like N1pC/P60 family cysteine hydrolase [Phenylobacterium sp.]HLZ76129.1 YiiX/YebB-like N1pC/P60 family cysteine hydrolase [Phenylobacterium sp.]